MTIRLWHGSRRWTGVPEIKSATKGRAEAGTGIYLTTHYETAQKYAKGGGRVMLVDLDADLAWLEQSQMNVENLKWFVKDLSGLKNRQAILDGLDRAANRLKRSDIPVSSLVNLFVNYDVSHGKSGLALTTWLADHHIDASLQNQGDEDWVVIYNPKCIKKVSVINPDLEHLRYTSFNSVKNQLDNLQEESGMAFG